MKTEHPAQPSTEANGLHDEEVEEAQKRSTIGPQIVHEAVAQEGREELERPPTALAWSGLAAGLSMGFSLVAEGLLHSSLPDAPWRPLLTKFGYCVGFIIVVMGRQQLFTENTLTVVLPLLERKDRETLMKMLRLWTIVLTANLAGALAFAGVIGFTDLFKPEVREAFAAIGQQAVDGGFMLMFLRGIFAAWLIALMVWLLPAAKQSRFHVIVVITWLVGIGGFSHVVAGATEVFYLAWQGLISIPAVFTRFLIPVLIGNIIGGVSLVAILNHQQVHAGKEETA